MPAKIGVNAGAGASAGGGGGIAGVTQDYYSFPYTNYDEFQALAQYILFADGNNSLLDHTMWRLFSACQTAFTNQTTMADAYKGDSKGLDLQLNAKAEAHAGASALNAIDFEAQANVGSEGHAYLNIKYLQEIDEYEYSFGVSGSFSSDASAGLNIDIIQSTEMDDIREEINLWELGGRRAFEFAAFRNYATGDLTFFELRLMKRNDVTGKAEKITYRVPADQVLNSLSNLGSDIMEIITMHQGTGSFIISKSTFQEITSKLFTAFVAVQSNQQGNASISYSLEKTDIVTSTDNPVFSVEAQLTTALRLGLSGGNGFEQSKSMVVKSGKWVMGKHYPEWTYDQAIPDIQVEYEDKMQEIIDQIPVLVKTTLSIIDKIVDFYTSPLNKSDSTVLIGDNGAYFTFSETTWPTGIDTITCASWSWYGNAPSKGKSKAKSGIKIYEQNKALAISSFGMDYGVGGFYQFEPYEALLADTAWLSIAYSDSDIVGMDETKLSMYYENKSNHSWVFVGGTVDTANNILTAPITQLALYTLAPAMPFGSFGLNVSPDSIFANSISVSEIISDTIRNNDLSIVDDGQLFTIRTNQGKIITADVDTTLDGLQLTSSNGIIQFTLKSSHVAGLAKVTAKSVSGSANATDTVVFFDTIPPVAPINLVATADNGKVHIRWNKVNEDDLTGYIIYFDTDTTIPPYNGISTVWGKPSPIITGVDTSYTVYGLFNDTLYHFAVTAYDVSGNESNYSNISDATPLFDPTTVDAQEIHLPAGWSILSTYIIPFEPSVDSVFSQITSNITIVKNGNGQVYWPQFSVNLIGSIVIGEGYQIKTQFSDTLIIFGTQVEPESVQIPVPASWSILGYLRQTPGLLNNMLSSLSGNIVLIKNGIGQVYWPQYGVNLIGNMLPGEGYQIKMLFADTLIYPANSTTILKPGPALQNLKHFWNPKNTGNNMTLGIPLSSWEYLPDYGDEIGVFSSTGEIVGATVFSGNNAAITIWGNDNFTLIKDGLLNNENFLIKLWGSGQTSETKKTELIVENWIEGDDKYETNKISITGKIITSEPFEGIILYKNKPNPFGEETEFSFYLPEKTWVGFTILNLLGEVVETLISKEMEAGKHSLKYQTKNLSAGSYYYRLETEDFSDTKKMVIIR